MTTDELKTQLDTMREELEALKAIAAPQSEDRSQNHTVSAGASQLEKLRQLQAKHAEQRALEREMSKIAAGLETESELKIFLEAVMSMEVDTVKICEMVPNGGLRGSKPYLRALLPQWLQDAIDERYLARTRRF